MPAFTISVAGRNIEIVSAYSRAEKQCRDYIVHGAVPDFSVSVTKEDIEYERSQMADKTFGDAYLETLAIYRRICDNMAQYNAFLMHGAAVAVKDEAYMFTAPPGTGKTTHARLWLKNIPGAYIVNGDKPLVLEKNGAFFACGTPWCGKENMSTNTVVPLKAVVILRRGDSNAIRKVSPADQIVQILKQIYMPSGGEAPVKVMGMAERLMNSLAFYELSCNMDDRAAAVSYEALKNN